MRILWLVLLLVAACAPAANPATTPGLAPTSGSTVTQVAQPRGTSGSSASIQVALGFVPSVQSAPFYLAQDRGYYAAQGLQVELKYGTIENLLELVSNGDVAFGLAAGDAMIPQRLEGVHIRYVLTFWSRNPIGALGISGNNVPPLRTPADLKGKTVGVSAPNSSTDFGLRALLQAGHLANDDVRLVSIGTTEVEALIQKRIDAAMTFLPNEAAQMKSLGFDVDTVPVADYLQLVPPGVVAGDRLIAARPEVVQKFVSATMRGYEDMLADPDAAFEASLKRMPELSVDKRPLQRDTLTATLAYYKPPQGRPIGTTDPAAWSATQRFLESIGVIDHIIDPAEYYTNTFAEQANVP